MPKAKTRIEKDSMGEIRVPSDALYGAQTQRARENFPVSGIRESEALIKAYILLKRAAAMTNAKLGTLDKKISAAIKEAADEILTGKYIDQFVVDVFQAGAGTSFNMNCNEVLANLAAVKLGKKKTEHYVHPNDHVNMGQSTNDTFPAAMRISASIELDKLIPVLKELENSFRNKGKEFDGILKSGRTHLQDAVPVRLGQEFKAYAGTVSKCRKAIEAAGKTVLELGIGGSAAGTGLNTLPEYSAEIVNEISRFTRKKFRCAPDLREAMQSNLPIVTVSGSLRNFSVEMIRIANDLRLLSSGPTTGFGEIKLPPVQPGSSIMPGKVNPVMAEMLNQVLFHVIGNDTTIVFAAQAGQMELNVMMPVMAYNLLQSIEILTNSLEVFRIKCVDGITAEVDKCREYAEKSVGLATILNTYIGYDNASKIAKESVESGKPIPRLILEKKLMTEDQLQKVLDTKSITEPGIPGKTRRKGKSI